MYRTIIVDDEIWSVIGLRKILEENSDQFKVIYETTDSGDALDRIIEMRPDVVFTDIRMPEMTGIDLMHNVRARGIQTEFVVVSGFAEFSYARQALQEGAIDYQLKPFDRNTVGTMLENLYAKLDNKKKAGDFEFYAALRDRRDNVKILLEEKFGRSLYPKIQVVLVYFKDAGFGSGTLEMGEESQYLPVKIGPRKCIYIVNANEDKTDILCDQLRLAGDKIEAAAVSRAGDDINLFEQLLREAETTVMDGFVYPEQKIFRFRKNRRDVINQLEERISELYLNKHFRKMGEMMLELRNLFVENDMGMGDAVYLWNRMVLLTAESADGDDFVLDYLNIYEMAERFADINEMSNYLYQLCGYDKEDRSGTVNDKFFELLRYINENYAEPLLLRELCNQFFINMSYCCELFQKHKNMTFSQYLTDVRIGKACELLKYHKLTVSETCDRVGYNDYFYFNKVFKKKMGCTPAEYRKSMFAEG